MEDLDRACCRTTCGYKRADEVTALFQGRLLPAHSYQRIAAAIQCIDFAAARSLAGGVHCAMESMPRSRDTVVRWSLSCAVLWEGRLAQQPLRCHTPTAVPSAGGAPSSTNGGAWQGLPLSIHPPPKPAIASRQSGGGLQAPKQLLGLIPFCSVLQTIGVGDWHFADSEVLH